MTAVTSAAPGDGLAALLDDARSGETVALSAGDTYEVDGHLVVPRGVTLESGSQKYGLSLDRSRTVAVGENAFEGGMEQVYYVTSPTMSSEHE